MTLTSWAFSRVRGRCLLAVCVIFLASLPAFSQANLGRILGAVTDQSGGVVAGATVTILDVQRGISRSLKQNSDWHMELLDEANKPVFRIRLVAETLG